MAVDERRRSPSDEIEDRGGSEKWLPIGIPPLRKAQGRDFKTSRDPSPAARDSGC